MSFATDGRKPGRIALILGGQTLGRLVPGLRSLVGPSRDFGAIRVQERPSRIVAQLLEWQPVGVIMEFREELTELVSGMGFPTVVVMADMLVEGMGSVNVDDYRIGELAATYLWEKGLRQFAMYGFESLHAPERRTGYIETIESRGASVRVWEVSGDREARARRSELDQWMRQLPKPTGLFAAHDPLGREAIESCSRLEFKVPSDVAILSASNDQLTCELVHPGISSVEIPWDQVGLQAGQLMERMLQGERPEAPLVVKPVGIHTRGSTDYYRVSDMRVQKAVDYMREHLAREINVEDVVRTVGMDRRALERLFRSQLGRSPKQVLTEMRTDRAREFLEQQDLRVGEIAERCGFGKSEKLATAFRRRFGKTPRDWRQNLIPARPGSGGSYRMGSGS